MDILCAKRLDHLGIVAGTIKDLGLIEAIDQQLPSSGDQSKISTGEAIAAMIINGLGFSNRPLSLTPQFFESKAIDLLFREGIEASDFNRHKLGRSLDDIYDYDCELLFSILANQVCEKEKVNRKFSSLDTTTFSVTGEYDVDSDENMIALCQGYSKDHRPDLKQAVLEMMVSQDGGIPLVAKSFDGK